jgi:acetolactate synthase-1/2/3 large subunit
MGTALTCTHQSIRLGKDQRIITSTGLGEMGYGLPGSIGACFANEGKRIVLITGDGSMMMNLQELQTIAHHKLPIKIFVYINDGYLTIKQTQMGLFGKRFTASGKNSGVTCPDFSRVGAAFGFKTFRLKDENNMDAIIEKALKADGPVICEVMTDPLQPLVPKLSFAVLPDGKMVSPPLEDLSPFLTREELKKEMIIGLSNKSLAIKDENPKTKRGGTNANKK